VIENNNDHNEDDDNDDDDDAAISKVQNNLSSDVLKAVQTNMFLAFQ